MNLNFVIASVLNALKFRFILIVKYHKKTLKRIYCLMKFIYYFLFALSFYMYIKKKKLFWHYS